MTLNTRNEFSSQNQIETRLAYYIGCYFDLLEPCLRSFELEIDISTLKIKLNHWNNTRNELSSILCWSLDLKITFWNSRWPLIIKKSYLLNFNLGVLHHQNNNINGFSIQKRIKRSITLAAIAFLKKNIFLEIWLLNWPFDLEGHLESQYYTINRFSS